MKALLVRSIDQEDAEWVAIGLVFPIPEHIKKEYEAIEYIGEERLTQEIANKYYDLYDRVPNNIEARPPDIWVSDDDGYIDFACNFVHISHKDS